MTLSPSWRMDGATAYLETLQARGLSLEVVDGRILIPDGETDAEFELLRLLKPELLAMLQPIQELSTT